MRLLLAQQSVDEVLQLGPERVARGHHAERLAVLDHRNMSEAARVHEVQRAHERQAGGAIASLDAAWTRFDRALAGHGRRFPAGRALVRRLRGLAALEAGQLHDARRALATAVRLAEAQGLRVELARSCEALGSIETGPHWTDRARRQWRDMGAPEGGRDRAACFGAKRVGA